MQKVICNIKKAISFRAVLAEGEGTGTDPVPTPAPTPAPTPVPPVATPQPVIPMVNYEQLIAQARKEEKDKLYPEITALKAQVKDLTKSVNDALLQVGTKEARIQELTVELEKAKTGNVDPAEVTTLKEKIVALEGEVNTYKAQAEQAEFEKLKNAEIEKYQGKVIPELITGTTAEEIAESVKASNARYLEILGVAPAPTPTPTQPTMPVLAGGLSAPTPVNPTVAGAGFDNRVVTDEMVRGMNMQQYAEYRKQLGLK